MRSSAKTDFTTLTVESKSYRIGGESLLAEAESVHAVLNIAEAATDAEKAFLDARTAREALNMIGRLLEHLEFDISLRQAIEAARDQLQIRLSSLERRFLRQ